MAVIYQLDRSKGLGLILHTPGRETAATESLIDYLHSMFGDDIRAIVPQLAMSAGTMIACACKEIVMGKHSSLGPIDPQFRGTPAHGIKEEFLRAYQEIKTQGGAIDQAKIAVWQPILAKYPPAFVGECEKAIDWSNEIVTECLKTVMFKGDPDAATKAETIVNELADHSLTKSHARHLSVEKCNSLGLKIIENQNGVAFIQIAKQVMIQQQ